MARDLPFLVWSYERVDKAAYIPPSSDITMLLLLLYMGVLMLSLIQKWVGNSINGLKGQKRHWRCMMVWCILCYLQRLMKILRWFIGTYWHGWTIGTKPGRKWFIWTRCWKISLYIQQHIPWNFISGVF